MKYLLTTIIYFSSIFFCFSQEAKILENKEDITITELKSLNSTSRETNISISPDGKYLYFMSDRGGMKWSSYMGTYKGKKRYDGDIWFSTKIDGKWQNAKCLDNSINTYSGEDEPNISPDGQFVTYQSWAGSWSQKGGPYFTAFLEAGKWTNPQGLSGGITKFFSDEFSKFYGYATDGMSVSPDRNTFIVACGGDYEGNMDLFISRRQKGEWSYCKKMEISTDSDERSVFIAGDGKTIFFASNGYGGFGGLDILKTTLNEDGSFGEVLNIGEPFNTENDDYSFILTASGEDAYFVRDGNIFHADLSSANEELKPEPTVVVNGKIIDCDENPVETFIELFNVNDDFLVSTSKSSSEGEFSFAFIENEAEYKIVSAENTEYEIDTSFYVNELGKYQEIIINIETCLNRFETNEKEEFEINLQQKEISLLLNFDFDKDSIKSEDYEKINEFIEDIENLDNYKLEIIGHTDSKGNDDYNVDLGFRRAENVEKYLLEKGIPQGKINTSTKGEKDPAEKFETEENSYKNRRVEIKITYFE